MLAKLEELWPNKDAVISLACEEERESDTSFTMNELKSSLRPRRDTAAVVDRISHFLLQHAGPAAHQEFLHVVNASYAEGLLLSVSKEATIQPVPKPGKPLKTRPSRAALLSCLGKTTEKMDLERLQWSAGSLHENIYGYTQGCVTVFWTY